jgi:hypothetical protein
MTMVERFAALRDTYGTEHCVLSSDYDALEVELRAEIARLKEVCRRWACSHAGLLVAISEAGFTVQYEDYKEPCQTRDRRRSVLVSAEVSAPGYEFMTDSVSSTKGE